MSSFQIEGTNDSAPFTLKVHRGDGMVLLGMNWRDGIPPRDFVGFAIRYRLPGNLVEYRVHNRIGFPGQDPGETGLPSTEAPIQKFRWVHFTPDAGLEGAYRYRVSPMFMGADGSLREGPSQTVDLELMRQTLPGKMNVAFTRGFIASQAFVHRFGGQPEFITLVPPSGDEGLTFQATHPKAAEAFDWMGFEARRSVLGLLDAAIATPDAQVRAICFDLNLPEVVDRLVALGPRLRLIVDDSDRTEGHGRPASPETLSAMRIAQSTGAGNVRRQHMRNLQHHKSLAVRGTGIGDVVYGSTNLSWRGLYVQSNHAVTVTSQKAVDDYFTAFEAYFAAPSTPAFMANPASVGWFDLGLSGIDARVAFSPHGAANGRLDEIGADIDRATSSVIFSLAFLGQTTRGAIGPALGRALNRPGVHVMGVADAAVHEDNLGLAVMTPDNRRRIVRAASLTQNAPPPFLTEPTALAGPGGNQRGTRMHHKFVVLDFDTPDARVYFGSYNFSVPADQENGENLVFVRDRTVATSFMIEALRIYDHYVFRAASERSHDTPRRLELKPAPTDSNEPPWFQRDWDIGVRARDREKFS